MRVKEVLANYELYLVDLEVMLNGEKRSAPTLSVKDGENAHISSPKNKVDASFYLEALHLL